MSVQKNWDSYFYPGTQILRNFLNEYDSVVLHQFECEKISARTILLAAGSHLVEQTFDACHLKAIHAYLFQDVYDWAGEYRKVNMSKGFTAFADIDGGIDEALSQASSIIAHHVVTDGQR